MCKFVLEQKYVLILSVSFVKGVYVSQAAQNTLMDGIQLAMH